MKGVILGANRKQREILGRIVFLRGQSQIGGVTNVFLTGLRRRLLHCHQSQILGVRVFRVQRQIAASELEEAITWGIRVLIN